MRLCVFDHRSGRHRRRGRPGAVADPERHRVRRGDHPVAEHLDGTVASLSQDIIDIVTTLLS